MVKKPGGTPALLALDAAQVTYVVHEYDHDPRYDKGFGLEGAEKLGADPHRVFKTLCASVDGSLCVGVVPVSSHLDLKALAATLSGKKAEMAQPADAQKATGYVLGGISPVGQKHAHPTVIDESALEWDTILVSGGRRGLDIELAPDVLADLISAQFAAIAKA